MEAQLARQRAFDALRRMREKKESATQASHEAGTTLRAMRRHVGAALRKTTEGRYQPTRTDRLPRVVRFLTPQGIIAVSVSQQTATRIAHHWIAVDRFWNTGHTDALREFRGRFIRAGGLRYPFVTDPRTLTRLGNAGEIAFEDLYVITL